LDENYPTALLNRANVHLLLGQSYLEAPTSDALAAEDQYYEAAYYARKALKLAEKMEDPATKASVHVLRGILADAEGLTYDVASHFAKAGTHPLAKANLSILETGKLPDQPAGSGNDLTLKEEIDERSLDGFQTSSWDRTQSIRAGRSNFQLKVLEGGLPNSKILYHYVGRGKQSLLVHQTGHNYQATTAWDIGLGATQTEIEEEYGSDRQIVSTAEGTLMIYPAQAIIFLLEGGILRKWYVYRKQ
ncbi:MAG: hypothetical protein AAFU03_19000, partial [Bacteroidota bacterium]